MQPRHDEAQWNELWKALAELPETDVSLTWKSDRLGANDVEPSSAVYLYYLQLIRGEWLGTILGTTSGDDNQSVANMLNERGIQLRCEPGRTLIDGCGISLAEGAFTKARSSGVSLVGLHMNRTQYRSTSADFSVDLILIHAATPRKARKPGNGFLVGAYCIEKELILHRHFEFPRGVAAGDLVAFPNPSGYLMNIIESASHQVPLANNLRCDEKAWVLDDVDSMILR